MKVFTSWNFENESGFLALILDDALNKNEEEEGVQAAVFLYIQQCKDLRNGKNLPVTSQVRVKIG